jgi:hypothetical protein
MSLPACSFWLTYSEIDETANAFEGLDFLSLVGTIFRSGSGICAGLCLPDVPQIAGVFWNPALGACSIP